MFSDEFYYRPRLSTPLWNHFMVFEGEGGEGGEGEGGSGGGGEGEGESWLNEGHDYLSDDDKKTLSKYKTQQAAIEATVHSTKKFAEYDEQISKAVHFPNDETSEDDKVKFNTKVAEYQGVPAEPKGYVLERPKELPEGMSWDEGMETWFRETIHASKTPQAAAEKLFKAYCERKIGEHNVYQEVAKASEQELKDELKTDFNVWFGDPKDKESIGTIKQTVMELSKELGLDYKDDKDVPQSKLADCLELQRHNGCLGDMAPILKVLNFIHKTHYAEGATVTGDFSEVKGEGGKSVFDFEDMDGDKNKGDDYGLS